MIVAIVNLVSLATLAGALVQGRGTAKGVIPGLALLLAVASSIALAGLQL